MSLSSLAILTKCVETGSGLHMSSYTATGPPSALHRVINPKISEHINVATSSPAGASRMALSNRAPTARL
jgi:hypothetical protein